MTKGFTGWLPDTEWASLRKKLKIETWEEFRKWIQGSITHGKNCLWSWTDGTGDLTCPIRTEDPDATWDKITSKACGKCPRYIKAVGTKELVVKRIQEQSIARGNEGKSYTSNPKFAGYKPEEKIDWKDFNEYLLSLFDKDTHCSYCNNDFVEPSDLVDHLWKIHRNNVDLAIEEYKKQR